VHGYHENIFKLIKADSTIRHSIKIGLSFGFTSGVITTLGLMVGLHSGTNSELVIVGGILTIAIADSFSDALGIHTSEESENRHSHAEIWESTFSTFFSKFALAMTFLIPVLVLSLSTAIVVSVIWGLFVLSFMNYYIAKMQYLSPWKPVLEHLCIALLVILITHFTGDWISHTFG
jgi:VIT1/CCC1 family predicted Fe2+/Mn2+ transporter